MVLCEQKERKIILSTLSVSDEGKHPDPLFPTYNIKSSVHHVIALATGSGRFTSTHLLKACNKRKEHLKAEIWVMLLEFLWLKKEAQTVYKVKKIHESHILGFFDSPSLWLFLFLCIFIFCKNHMLKRISFSIECGWQDYLTIEDQIYFLAIPSTCFYVVTVGCWLLCKINWNKGSMEFITLFFQKIALLPQLFCGLK